MSFVMTRTKVVLPRRRSDLLTRQRLLNLLYELLDDKLIIVAAPAGYGKTSLLVDFAENANWPVCWYALDSLDQAPERFLTYFIAAIEQRFPGFGSQAQAALNAALQGAFDIERVVTAIINDIYEHIHEHFLIVLDDYHLVSGTKEIDDFINRFVQDVGENCHLVISSRSLLTIPNMPLLVARSQVGGLSFEELAFSPEEVQALIMEKYSLAVPQSAAEDLARETEGWVTGLLLSAQTMWQGMTDRLRVARVSGVGLYDYLAQQVLEQQPEEIRHFLLRTSVLEEFDLELVEAVFGRDQDWAPLVESILQNNLFVLPVGEDGTWIRYHHLFRDFLQARFEEHFPEEKNLVLQNLARVYASRREWEKAHAIYRRLGDRTGEAELVQQAGSDLIKNGRMSMLSEWIHALPTEAFSRMPRLQSLRGVVLVTRGKVEAGLEALNTAVNALQNSEDRSGLARTLARRAVTHRFQGNYPAALQDASQALSICGDNHEVRDIRADALRLTGGVLVSSGQIEEAVQYLHQAHAVYRSLGDRQNMAQVTMEMGVAHVNTGRYHQASEDYRQTLDYWRDAHNPVGQANTLNNLGVLNHLLGEYKQAAQLFEETLELARQHGFKRIEAFAFTGVGDLYADLDAGTAALDAYQKAREIAQPMGNRFLLLYLELAEATLARKAGDFSRASERLAAAWNRLPQGGASSEHGYFALAQGQLSLSTGAAEEAAGQLQEAIRCFDNGGQVVEAARAYLCLAAAWHAAGQLDQARTAVREALRRAAKLESQHVLVVTAQQVKTVLEADQEDPEVQQQVERLQRQVQSFETHLSSIRRSLRKHTSSVPFAPPKITIRALGRAQVELDGKPVTVPEWLNQKRVREFFFTLLSRPEGMTKEEIGLMFWPDSSTAQLKQQFKNLIYRLRYALGQDVVLFDEYRYWFNRGLDYEYDVETFLNQLSKAEAAEDPGEKIAAFRAAVDTYRGSYFVEAEGNWVWQEREHLREMHLDALLSLARLHLHIGEYKQTLEYCQRIQLIDDCLEEAYRLAMEAHHHSGNRGGVKRQFERCRQALLREINASPSDQTVSLYRRLCT